MLNFCLKIIISAFLIAAISGLSNRYMWLSAILASIPLVSVLAMIWMFADHRTPEQISAFCSSTFWMVLPSLILFIALPVLLKKGFAFYYALPISLCLMMCGYFLMTFLLSFSK